MIEQYRVCFNHLLRLSDPAGQNASHAFDSGLGQLMGFTLVIVDTPRGEEYKRFYTELIDIVNCFAHFSFEIV